jgi:hypothetical protein
MTAQSLNLIVRADMRDDANKMLEAMGYGPATFIVPLSLTGVAPATHYGAHAWGDLKFCADADGMGKGRAPDVDFGRVGVSKLRAGNVVRQMNVRAVAADAKSFDELCAELNLKRIEPDEPLIGAIKAT